MDDDQFIAGIYNYCDRWCERCTMTSRCRLYADEQEENVRKPESRDPDNEEFWERIDSNFEKAFEMLQEMMDEKGIEISDEEMEEESLRQKEHEEIVDADPLGQLGHGYGMAVHEWFKNNSDVFSIEAESLETEARLELPGTDPARDAERLNDAIDVLGWYQFQIGVKLKRAISSQLEDRGVDWGDGPSDADGSAKVCLIGIDRSLGAWEILRERFDQDDAQREANEEVFEFMLRLTRLRRGVEERFPDARTVKRPGFDD